MQRVTMERNHGQRGQLVDRAFTETHQRQAECRTDEAKRTIGEPNPTGDRPKSTEVYRSQIGRQSPGPQGPLRRSDQTEVDDRSEAEQGLSDRRFTVTSDLQERRSQLHVDCGGPARGHSYDGDPGAEYQKGSQLNNSVNYEDYQPATADSDYDYWPTAAGNSGRHHGAQHWPNESTYRNLKAYDVPSPLTAIERRSTQALQKPTGLHLSLTRNQDRFGRSYTEVEPGSEDYEVVFKRHGSLVPRLCDPNDETLPMEKKRIRTAK